MQLGVLHQDSFRFFFPVFFCFVVFSEFLGGFPLVFWFSNLLFNFVMVWVSVTFCPTTGLQQVNKQNRENYWIELGLKIAFWSFCTLTTLCELTPVWIFLSFCHTLPFLDLNFCSSWSCCAMGFENIFAQLSDMVFIACSWPVSGFLGDWYVSMMFMAYKNDEWITKIGPQNQKKS